MKMTIEYPAGHSYTYNWERSDVFCPGCSAKTVWMDSSEGDIYVGPEYICVSCDSSFYLPSEVGPIHTNDSSGLQKLAALKAAEIAEKKSLAPLKEELGGPAMIDPPRIYPYMDIDGE